MTVTMPAPVPTPAKVAFPARCAVTIAYDHHLVSQVFPAGIAVEAFFEGMVELLDEDLKRRGQNGVALPAGSYELHRINGARLDLSRSLDDLGVQDGDTLVLAPAVDGDSVEPQYESLSTALAATGKRLGAQPEIKCSECGHKADEQTVARLLSVKVDRWFAPVTALTAAHTVIAIVAMAVVLLGGLALRARAASPSWVPAAVSAGVAALMITAAVVVVRNWPARRDLFSGFAWPAVAATAVAAACAPPGELGAAHAVVGLLVAVVGTVGISVLSRSQTAAATAVVTVSVVAAVIATARMWHPVSAQVLGICTALGLLAVVRMAPTVALWVARVRPPYFGSITGRDLFARRDGLPIDTVSPVTAADEEDADDELTDLTARGAAVKASARLVNAVQIGMCVAAAAVLPVAVWMLLNPGGPRQWAAVALGAVVAGLFLTQARGFAAKGQAVALVVGACVAVFAGIARYGLAAPADSVGGLVWPALVVIAFTGLGMAAGLLVPATRFVPWIRLAVVWVEVAAFVAVGLLGAWLGGLFAWVRN